MISTTALLHFAAYSVSLPSATTVASKLVKETVYMPSAVAARLLGHATPEVTGGGKDEPAGETR